MSREFYFNQNVFIGSYILYRILLLLPCVHIFLAVAIAI